MCRSASGSCSRGWLMDERAAAYFLGVLWLTEMCGLGPREQDFPAKISDTHLFLPGAGWISGACLIFLLN